jgi:hypothetical protein
MKLFFKSYICGACLLLSSLTWGEVYRWVDSAGKVHYSDKKPAAEAEDITAQVAKQNIDTSTEEHKKLEQILRKENAADRQFYQSQDVEQRNAQVQRCNFLRQRLQDVSGRVQFVDNGKPVHVSERARQAQEAEMRSLVARECSE